MRDKRLKSHGSKISKASKVTMIKEEKEALRLMYAGRSVSIQTSFVRQISM
jgi:hypothetical protein